MPREDQVDLQEGKNKGTYIVRGPETARVVNAIQGFKGSKENRYYFSLSLVKFN